MESAKKTCSSYKDGTSAGVTITPNMQKQPQIAEIFVNDTRLRKSFLNMSAAKNKNLNNAISRAIKDITDIISDGRLSAPEWLVILSKSLIKFLLRLYPTVSGSR